MPTRRGFLGTLAASAAARLPGAAAPPIALDAVPTALYAQPDGQRNLVRIAVRGLDAPAARARVSDAHGRLLGTAGLLPLGAPGTLSGEVWLPLAEAAEFDVDVEVGKQRVARRRVRLTPPRRWTLYWLASNHTDVGYTDLQEHCLEIHRENLDAALARLAGHPDFRWTAECALQVLSYAENRPAAAVAALTDALRAGTVGWSVLFANMLTGILDHETLARLVWPAGRFARLHGLGFTTAQLTDVPGQVPTLPSLLAASGVRYLATGPNADRALPLLTREEATSYGLTGDFTAYPQLYWWEGPDGARVLHWRNHHYGDGLRFGFDVGAAEMAQRLSDWLLGNPAFAAADFPYDTLLLYGCQWDNAPVNEQMIANVEEFNRRFAYPRIMPARAEEFFQAMERRYGPRIPVRRGDTGVYWEDGAASTARALARFRRAQLAARAADVLALWDDRTEGADDDARRRIAARAEERRAMWRDLLLFGEHTWGAAESITAPDSRETVEQWEYKRRFVDGAAAAAEGQVRDGLLRLGRGQGLGRGRIVFNAANWARTDVARVPGGAGRTLQVGGAELPTVDLPDGDALALFRDVPPLGYVALAESDRAPRPPADEGPALEAAAGGFRVRLDPATGAVASLAGPDGRERVKPAPWSGLNQLVYATGGDRTALWTTWDRATLATAPVLDVHQAALVSARRERLPGIGVRLVASRTLAGMTAVTSTVTLYDELPFVDFENRLTKTPTLDKEALYVAFPFALAAPAVELEVGLGRMRVEADQMPGACRDWFCHNHWVWLHTAGDGVLWSGPDTPLFTLNDLFRGAWRRRLAPDGTLFAYAMNNYWETNYAARQGGEWSCRFRIAPLGGTDAAEPVRRGWAACDPLYVSAAFANTASGPLTGRDTALVVPDAGLCVVGAKRADDGDGVVVKLLDVAGAARGAAVWPGAYDFRAARACDLVERNGAAIPVGADRRAATPLPAWGVAALRLFTPASDAG